MTQKEKIKFLYKQIEVTNQQLSSLRHEVEAIDERLAKLTEILEDIHPENRRLANLAPIPF